ncbi:glycoside hydrolase family 65 protein [Pimelobacter simplex]|uniref:Maltose phosphorylase n=1 Tax=Nocardioides simplex TaxID=2045 RepID=A0A0C5XC10_NOCSI|nr:glycosyl hydrolase family 65 protein [Pimelobacter simplex]AJR18840.1 Maltose phosphorylase [Pimelobacter simplex]MCG8149622.1 glycoside hydrolase family 65 protein [Pimelobacter simplex]GEB16014.1 kojibiose phosphorylase [Pimelobacter simplex]SFM82214.1 alpha,alpha-trehalose phosphorylase [Pimelobacter simplex]
MNAPEGPGPSHVAPSVADPLDRTRFPVDEWRLVETRFDGSDLGTTESLFSVGNGYLGLRGNYSESRDAYQDGTFINGFHETWPISHAEEAYGFARIGQTIVNVPDPKVIRLYVDDEPLQVSVADLIEYERALDFRDGVLSRELLWRTPGGKRVSVRSTRMVPLEQRHLAVLTFEVTLLDQHASLAISSQLVNRQDEEVEQPTPEAELAGAAAGGGADPRKAEAFDRRVLLPRLHGADPETARIKLGYRTVQSGMTVGVVADHALETTSSYSMSVHSEDDLAKVIYRIAAEPGVPVRLTKTVAFHTAQTVPPRELIDRCERTLDRTREEGIARQYAAQRAWLDDFWSRADVEVPGQPALQQAIRWNLFAVLQASARAEGQGIAAKGVSGSGYGGHYFWDTEIYVMPFLTYTMPWAARNALRFRYSLLGNARHRARELSQKGALFPWRTINGHEASAYYAAGTAQYHIDADIAYALSQYVGATGDEEFLAREAVDIFVETARLWADLGFWRDESRRTFHIHGVTGPDEYTTVVNDNLYTNVLARFNLRRAARAVWELQRDDPDAYEALVRRTGLSVEEPDEWAEAAQAMSIPFDEFLGIHPQDAHFLEREMWDLENTPLEKRPLLLHYHPLVIYRFQVLKQADVVLALYLQGEEFTAEQKKADFDYYDPITTGDSTLSAVMQSVMAAEVGYHELALRYFMSALFVDLADRHNNTADGVHVASTGGVWSALVSGFGGFRDIGSAAGDQQWQIDPRLPDGWESLTYRVTLHGTRVRVTVRPTELELAVEHGTDPVPLCVRGEVVKLAPGAPVVLPLEHQGPRLEGEPPYPAGIQRADGTVISAIIPTGD